jgi:major membrane immunogen (membrane-anchored lipoprotein)|tara:strand:+ start:541 stop:702 length:162 start_codon:yes stop_codon:yes gene_type:complete
MSKPEEANYAKHNLPTIENKTWENFITLSYPDGKIVKSFKDKRKKDIILQEKN